MPYSFRDRTWRAALKTGEIFFDNNIESLDCLVWEIGKFGALIEVKRQSEIPDIFRLISTALFLNEDCEVLWREGRKIELKFVPSMVKA